MTSVEETIRMPAWRIVSPVKASTRPLNVSRTTSPVNLKISPALCRRPRTRSPGPGASRSGSTGSEGSGAGGSGGGGGGAEVS